mmetsp:Transcript_31491/g.53751  ORF Transcript_31491/g.53751 Transcript_31491/m.53751 type:complete len:96 (-) Transcript_31491:244-531(-)
MCHPSDFAIERSEETWSTIQERGEDKPPLLNATCLHAKILSGLIIGNLILPAALHPMHKRQRNEVLRIALLLDTSEQNCRVSLKLWLQTTLSLVF